MVIRDLRDCLDPLKRAYSFDPEGFLDPDKLRPLIADLQISGRESCAILATLDALDPVERERLASYGYGNPEIVKVSDDAHLTPEAAEWCLYLLSAASGGSPGCPSGSPISAPPTTVAPRSPPPVPKTASLWMDFKELPGDVAVLMSADDGPVAHIPEKVTIGNKTLPVTEVGNNAFMGCSSLEEVVFPPTLWKIGAWAFSGCTSLRSVNLPASTGLVGEYAFEGCTSLEEVRSDGPPVSMTIRDYAFDGCTSLREFGITGGNLSLMKHALSGSGVEGKSRYETSGRICAQFRYQPYPASSLPVDAEGTQAVLSSYT